MKKLIIVAMLINSMLSFSQGNGKNKPIYTVVNLGSPYTSIYMCKINNDTIINPFSLKIGKYGETYFDDKNRSILLLPFDNKPKNIFYLLYINSMYISGIVITPLKLEVK